LPDADILEVQHFFVQLYWADDPIHPIDVVRIDSEQENMRQEISLINKPQIFSVVNNQGPSVGGTEVIITGNFTILSHSWATSMNIFCLFGQTFVEASRLNNSHITCRSPRISTLSGYPMDANRVPLRVSFGRNVANSLEEEFYFAYYSEPDIFKLVPDGGPCDSEYHEAIDNMLSNNQQVTVIGENFVNTSDIACYFGSTPVKATYVNETRILCDLPQECIVGSVRIRISLNGAQIEDECYESGLNLCINNQQHNIYTWWKVFQISTVSTTLIANNDIISLITLRGSGLRESALCFMNYAVDNQSTITKYVSPAWQHFDDIVCPVNFTILHQVDNPNVMIDILKVGVTNNG
jgi:hypothetical protein